MVDYAEWDDIEKHIYKVLVEELENICNVSINHSTVSRDIYDKVKESVDYGYSSVMIRCNNDNYSRMNPSGSNNSIETRTEVLLGFSKEINKGHSDQPRNQRSIMKSIWDALKKNPMYIKPAGKCFFHKSGKRIVFDDSEVQILSLDFQINYIN